MHLRHQTLTLQKAQEEHKHFQGSVSPDLRDPDKERGGACKRLCVLVVGLVFCVLLVVALAAGILSLVILFTGFVDTAVCNCATGESPDMHVMCV